VAVFQQWNPGASIAHHSHLASNAKYSIGHNIPTVILVREPAEAIASVIVWDGRLFPWAGLQSYLCFYQSLRKYRHKILFLGFHEAVTQPDKCIEKINQHFGTNFYIHEFTNEEDNQIRDILKNQDKRENKSELNSTLPNNKKTQLKKAIVADIKAHSLFMRAQTLYYEYSTIVPKHGESSID